MSNGPLGYVSVETAATMLGVSDGLVRRWIREGRLRAEKERTSGRGRYWVDRRSIEDLLAERAKA